MVWPRVGLAVVVAVLAVATGATTGASGVATQRAAHWCEARSSVAWRRVLARHIVPLSRTTPIHALAVANGGRSLLAEIYTHRFTGVAEINVKTGSVLPIKRFPDPTPAIASETADQAWGAFDGRWFVWKEFRGERDFNDFTVLAWDSRTGKVEKIGAADKTRAGHFYESPWQGALVRDGIAVWVQGTGANQLAEVHAYNLRTGRDVIVRHGHPSNAFLLSGNVAVWLEAPRPGAPTVMHAASALTGPHTPVPPALRHVRNAVGLVTDGDRIAYPVFSYRSLWWSPSLEQAPQEILATHGVEYVDNDVQIGGRYIGFGIQPGVYVGDSRTRRYVEVSSKGGSTLVDSTTLLVSYYSGSKTDPIERTALVRQRDLPAVPACAKTG